MDRVLAAREYAGHLTDADLRLLAPATRRVLNHLADRYLLAAGQSWFSAPGS